MTVTLIRHGMTAGNMEGRYVGGRTDQPLCPEGIAAAKALPRRPEVARVWVSPMLRARQTAAILFPGAEQTVCEGLREVDFGAFENRTADEMEHDPVYRSWVDAGAVDDFPGGDGRREYSARVLNAFTEIAQEAEALSMKELVVVSHGGTMMFLLDSIAEPRRESVFDWLVKNCRGWRGTLGWNGGAPVLRDIESV